MAHLNCIRSIAVGTLMLVATAVATLAEPSTWRAEGWSKTNFDKTTIKWAEVQSGGPAKDGIPSIDAPKFKPVAEDTELTAKDPVIGLEINGDARAYPLRVLIWHEIANDEVGGVPVAVTYCPLCNSAVVFERHLGDRVLDFGTTGKLRNSDLVMYDRQTESWWQQFTGEAIVGDLRGTELKLVPARLESFADFKARHPKGKLLVPNDPKLRDYGRNPYVDYDMAAAPFLFQGDLPQDIEAMARVVFIKRGKDKPTAVALELLRQTGKVEIDGFELTWRAGQASALHHWDVAQGRDVGSVVVSTKKPDGTKVDVPYDVTFAFVVRAFHPGLPIRQK